MRLLPLRGPARRFFSTEPALGWPLAPLKPAEPTASCVLSPHEAQALLELADGGTTSSPARYVEGALSIDLGYSSVRGLWVLPDGIGLLGQRRDSTPAAACVSWRSLKRMVKKGGAWRCEAGGAVGGASRVHDVSELTGRAGSLVPLDRREGGPPTARLGKDYMHRMKRMTPAEDATAKLGALRDGLRGRLLDVCTGLGYTALRAAGSGAVRQVVTVELDPLMVRLQASNPWSAPLFTHPKISRHIGCAALLLPSAPSGAFDCVCHDPPSVEAAGELYSAAFYAELRRVLRTGGRLYHYVGDPASRSAGRLFRGVCERLRAAGFEPARAANAYGVAAVAV